VQPVDARFALLVGRHFHEAKAFGLAAVGASEMPQKGALRYRAKLAKYLQNCAFVDVQV